MNYRQLYWKYRRMKEALEDELFKRGILGFSDWKVLAKNLYIRGQIDLLEKLMRENEW